MINNFKDEWIVKSNKLIEAKMRFTANEYKLITFLAGHIDIDGEEFVPLEIKLKDLNENCFKNSKNTNGTYGYVRNKYAYSLAKKNITIAKKDGNISIYNWFSVIETAKSTLSVCFSSKLKDFLLNNTKSFTSYKLKNILNLDTFYEIRIYEILKQYEKIGFRDIDLKNLKFMLGIEDNQIKRFADFKERVVNRALKKVNEKTDIKATYNFEKITNENIKFRFDILGKNTIRKSKELIEIKEKIENTLGREVHLSILESSIKKYKIKKKEIELYLKNWEKFNYKTKDDPVAFFMWVVANRKAIPEREEGINNMKPIQSTNFEQREYDDEFFESLYENF